MVNTTKGGDEGTPEVNTGKRDFLKKSITGGVTIAAMGILGGVGGNYIVDKIVKKSEHFKEEQILAMQPVAEVKDFDNSMNIATENLFDAYESLEFDVAKKYFTDNYINADANKLINLSVMIMHLENVGILNNVIQKKKDNMLFKFMNESHGNRSTIESTISYSNYLFAKKYPQLVPVIEEWKKKNGK